MNVTNTSLNTTVENNLDKDFNYWTFNGALFCLGIDNALIEIDSEEVPILDGSAKMFINKLIEAGIENSDSPIKIIKIKKKLIFLMIKIYLY